MSNLPNEQTFAQLEAKSRAEAERIRRKVEHEAKGLARAVLAVTPSAPDKAADAIAAILDPVGGLELVHSPPARLPRAPSLRRLARRRSMIVLDTKVLSEAMTPAETRSQTVTSWMRAQALGKLFTTRMTFAEILAGVAIVLEGKRRSRMLEAAGRVFASAFSRRVPPGDDGAARSFADLAMRRRRAGGHTFPLELQIGAIAASRNMAVATRNLVALGNRGVALVDPWNA